MAFSNKSFKLDENVPAAVAYRKAHNSLRNAVLAATKEQTPRSGCDAKGKFSLVQQAKSVNGTSTLKITLTINSS